MAHKLQFTFDDEVEHSALEREVTRDGVTVRLVIYRKRSPDARWILEIHHAQSGITEWDHSFDSEQTALDEALGAIDVQGIQSFVIQPLDKANASWSAMLERSNAMHLKDLLESDHRALSFQAACGVLATAVCGPYVLLKKRFDLLEIERLCKGDLDRCYFNDAATTLFGDISFSLARRGAHCCPEPGNHDAIRQFCTGYVKGAELDPVWAEDEQARTALAPIRVLAGAAPLPAELRGASREQREVWVSRASEALPHTLVWLTHYWREQQRDADACRCASGRSFRKCCAN